MDASWAARRLAAWFEKGGRDLSWRRFPEPYRILVAEFILQQTRMETGLRYYEKFLERFPTLESLARARVEGVLRIWSGLGYYARARNLHETARRIVRHHGGRVPSEIGELRRLPGIGPYTAGAIASIAYDRPEPALDGNQLRVLGRLTDIRDAATAGRRRRLEAVSRALLAQGSPRTLNQALMDLGSTVCLPRIPRCGACPLAARCPSKNRNRPEATPSHRSVARPHEGWTAVVHRRDHRIWLVEPKPSGLLAGLWLPPMRRSKRAAPSAHILHSFSHKRWAIHLAPSRRNPRGRGRWVGRQELASLPHSSLTRRILDAVLA